MKSLAMLFAALAVVVPQFQDSVPSVVLPLSLLACVRAVDVPTYNT